MKLNPIRWVENTRTGLLHPLLSEWSDGTNGALVTTPKGRMPNVYSCEDNLVLFVADINWLVMSAELGNMYERYTLWIVDSINYEDPDDEYVVLEPIFRKTNRRIEIGKSTTLVERLMQIVKARINCENCSHVHYGLQG